MTRVKVNYCSDEWEYFCTDGLDCTSSLCKNVVYFCLQGFIKDSLTVVNCAGTTFLHFIYIYICFFVWFQAGYNKDVKFEVFIKELVSELWVWFSLAVSRIVWKTLAMNQRTNDLFLVFLLVFLQIIPTQLWVRTFMMSFLQIYFWLDGQNVNNVTICRTLGWTFFRDFMFYGSNDSNSFI